MAGVEAYLRVGGTAGGHEQVVEFAESAFNPLMLSPPPALWYDAADIGGVGNSDPLDEGDGWPSHLVGGEKCSVSGGTAPTWRDGTGGEVGNLPAVQFNGTSQYCEVPSPGAAASGWTFYFVLSGIGGSGERRYFDSQTGRLLLKQRESATGQASYGEGANQTKYGAAVTSNQIMVWSFSAAEVIVRRNGVTLTPETAPTWTNRAIGGITNLGASITPNSYFQGMISEWMAVPAGHNLATIGQMETWLDAKYPLIP